MLHSLDETSRVHLRAFAGQVGFLAAICSPVLLIDSHAPVLYLLQLRIMFGFTALAVFSIGVFSRRSLAPHSFCIWDHVLALLLLKSGCSIALSLLK
jgi:hypothetical protein